MSERNIVDTTGVDATNDGRQSRSLAERLLELDSAPLTQNPRETPGLARDLGRANRDEAAIQKEASAAPSRGERRSNWSSAIDREIPRRVSPGALDNAMEEARSYVRTSFRLFLVSVIVTLILSAISSAFFLASVINYSDWQKPVITGAFSLVTVAFVFLLQYAPARNYRAGAAQVTQIEATRVHLNKAYELWERYLNERDSGHPITAEEMAIAVSSLTAATQGVVEIEPVSAKINAKVSEAVLESVKQEPVNTQPANSMPQRVYSSPPPPRSQRQF
jgi:hypothetical protein